MTDTDANVLSTFYKGINEFTEEFAAEKYRRPFPNAPKIIHDPLWGTIRLEPWEIVLLDLPLIQRLRQVQQTSLVSYVFPGCNHNRFEHTLGVVQQTQRLIDAVNRQYPSNRPVFRPTTVRSLRLAALFHDCGHSCFSHISEDLYESCDDMTAFFESGVFPSGHPHEALSALILNSKPVKQFIEEIAKHYKIDFDIEMAANWIIGKSAESGGKKKHYETQVINGPFDADKLDYILRDAHYSGLPVGLDLVLTCINQSNVS